MKNKKVILSCVGLCILIGVILTVVLVFANGKGGSTPRQNHEYTEFYEEINDINWVIKYDLTDNVVVSISSSYHEFDRSSKYWQEVARYQGDHNVSVDYDVVLSGVPLGDNWYKVEMQEVYSYSGNTLASRTIRYEEKLVFSVLP